MMKSIRTLVRQDREKYVIPRRVQDVIPIQKIWEDGIFLTGGRYAKSFRFTDINYQVASEPDKEKMFRGYSAIINSLDCGATTKITIFNHRMSQINFEKSILMPMQWDGLDDYREEYNQMLLDKATNGNGIVQEKFITISVRKKDVDAARSFFARVEADLSSHFAALGSTCGPMNAIERLQILHRFYRSGEENEFRFSLRDSARKGHCFRDYICPDFIERHSDYLQIGDRFARVLYLKDYASYIQDDFVSELTDLNRDMMLSIDMVPIPTDEAVREVENRLLGVETNITNWQRRQNSNNNFSAVVPYDMELQRKESKEFLDDLTTRDQRMIFGILTMVITAGTKDQLDADTDAILSTARKRMCQMAILKYQQMDGLNTVLTPSGIQMMSMNLLLENENDPVIWRGMMIAGTVQQFWTDVIWRDVDLLFIDMPPGTGDVPLTVFQSIPIAGVVVVTTPQDLVKMVVEKAVKMAEMMDVPVLGLVENMSYLTCPGCGKKIEVFGHSKADEIAAEYGIPAVAKLPIDPKIAELADVGRIEDYDCDALKEIYAKIEG